VVFGEPLLMPSPGQRYAVRAGDGRHPGAKYACDAGSVAEDDALRLHRESPVIDLHVHGPDFLPGYARRIYRASRPGRPPARGFDVLGPAGVDVAVANAVGDPIVTRWDLRRDAWHAVDEQLHRIERGARRAGVGVARTVSEMVEAGRTHQPVVVLGVEGADALGDDLDRLEVWAERGVRIVTVVHLGDNQFGTTCMPWQHYTGPVPVRRSVSPGLSGAGRRLVRRLQDASILVDVSHADGATVRGVIDVAGAPVVASHAGARAIRDFPRFLSDEELRMIAATGGVVGLWPYRGVGKGVRDRDGLMAHARHVAEVIGPEHLCFGTDMNGVPRHMAGYRGETDLPTITADLLAAEFTAEEVRGVIGGNALRVLRESSRSG
jgi:microsomal dipeptidase-like Zn-dependent dipeptidase